MLERHGFVEETYFDVSYDPVRVESGGVGGVYCIVTETTGPRRRRAPAWRCCAIWRRGRRRRGRRAKRVCWPWRRWRRTRRTSSLRSRTSDDELQSCTPGRRGHARRSAAATWCGSCRVLRRRRRPRGSARRRPEPQRPFDDQYRAFLELVASQLGTALANARAYEEERQRAEALAEIDRAKTAFFSNVSHEFRTPLTLILGPVEDCSPRTTRGRRRSRAHRARPPQQPAPAQAGQHAAGFLADRGRPRAGGVPADRSRRAHRRSRERVSLGGRARGHGARRRLPAAREPVYVDRDMWEKIVLNLVSNAFKFTLDGRDSCVAAGSEAASIVLTVADTGVGIPEGELPHVFERFHRVEGIQGRTHEGTGIGLALVQELARLHGGTVSVVSQPGAGSTFTVTMPAGSAHLPADRIATRRRTTPRRRSVRRPTSKRRCAGCRRSTAEAGGARYHRHGRARAAERSRRPRRVPVCSSPTTTPTCATMSSVCWARSYDVEAVPMVSAALAAARRQSPGSRSRRRHDAGARRLRSVARAARRHRAAAPCRSCCSRHAPARKRASKAGAPAPTTIWSSRSARASCSRASKSHLNLARVRRDSEAALRASEEAQLAGSRTAREERSATRQSHERRVPDDAEPRAADAAQRHPRVVAVPRRTTDVDRRQRCRKGSRPSSATRARRCTSSKTCSTSAGSPKANCGST